MTSPLAQPNTRVCDRCILRKTKCDLSRPTCSRCREGGWLCAYSSNKRQPGPSKGATRKTKSRVSSQQYGSQEATPATPGCPTVSSDHSMQLLADDDPSLRPTFNELMGGLVPSPADQWDFMRSEPAELLWSSAHDMVGLPPTLNQERALLDHFIQYVLPSLPLFNQQRLIDRYESGTLHSQLLNTILALTEIVTKYPNAATIEKPEDRLDLFLRAQSEDEDSLSNKTSLEGFQQACLLAFYAFHQHPGERSWMRIGQLTRKAYKRRLHRIDDADSGSKLGFQPSSPTDNLDEWRRIWWSIYCLDSYSNITSSTPFVVEAESIKTALVTGTPVNYGIDRSGSKESKFLPVDTTCLYKLVQDLAGAQREREYCMHIITVTILKEAANTRRLWLQTSSSSYAQRFKALEDDLAALRLALPARYTKSARNVSDGESSCMHHARLICNLHLYMARLFIYTPSHLERDKENWLDHWYNSLQTCEDIVSVVRCWDTEFSSTVDPAICFIVSSAIMMLHLHHCAEGTTPQTQSRTSSSMKVLIMFLDQFSSIWKLPQLLKKSCEKIVSLVKPPLTADDIDRILTQNHNPLDYEQLSTLFSTSNIETGDYVELYPEQVPLNTVGSEEEWHFKNWETVIGTRAP